MPRKSFKHDAPRTSSEDIVEEYEEEEIIEDTKSDHESSDTEVYTKKGKKKKKKPVDAQKLFNDVVELIQEFKNDEKIVKPKEQNLILPWVERFRPKKLKDVISHETITSTLEKFIEKKQFPHLLLSGPPGTGKTSAIMACARELYGDNYSTMVLDINASEERGIEVIRLKVRDFITTKAIYLDNAKVSTFKLVILDEADAMTIDAQAMLVSVMERYTINVRFCLICNYIKKISPSIQSRCTIFKFSPLHKKDITQKLNDISSQLKLNLTSDGIDMLIKISRGDMRKVLNIFQATNMAYDIVNGENVTNCIGYPTPKSMNMIYKLLTTQGYEECVNKINNIIDDNGYSINDIITELTDITIHNFMIEKISKEHIITILSNMREIEMNLTSCPSEKIQLTGLVGLFKIAFKN
jgi:replication factor C subunit 3/5